MVHGYRRLSTESDAQVPPLDEGIRGRGSVCEGKWCWLLALAIVQITLAGFLSMILAATARHTTGIVEPAGYKLLSPVVRNAPSNIVTFAPNRSFFGYTSHSKEAWAALMPKGRGFILVNDTQNADLAPGVPVRENVESYSLSAFHQLHCLATLREAFYQLKFGAAAADSLHSHDHDHLHQSAEHLDHCWDYLRQVIVCFADPAVEPARVDESGVHKDTDGTGGQHQCRSWELLSEFVRNNRAFDSEGLLG